MSTTQTSRRGPTGTAVTEAEVLRWQSGITARHKVDQLAREEPLEIRVRGRSVAVTMRTPGEDNELAAGFLVTEHLIWHRKDVVEIAHCQQGEAAQHTNTLNVFLAPDVNVDFARLTRHVFASSSCGVCGKASIEAVHQHFAPIPADFQVPGELLLRLPAQLRAAQSAFEKTGGLHAAAIFNRHGKLIVAREDVGRHNAVDKVVGFGFLNELLPFSEHILIVSGRASFEILQKGLAARISVVAAISAPSSLAVEFARESGQTLVGFVRGDSMNVYAHPERLIR